MSVTLHQAIQITTPSPWSLVKVSRLLALRFFAGRGLLPTPLIPSADPERLELELAINITKKVNPLPQHGKSTARGRRVAAQTKARRPSHHRGQLTQKKAEHAPEQAHQTQRNCKKKQATQSYTNINAAAATLMQRPIDHSKTNRITEAKTLA